MEEEVVDNPFRPGGELSREADEVLKHCTLIKDNIIINDPHLLPVGDVNTNTVINNTTTTNSTTNKNENGKAIVGIDSNNDLDNNPQPITGEVTTKHVEALPQQTPGKVEHVTIEKRKKGCCPVQ